MKIVRRDPDKGYLDYALWIPKAAVNVEGVKRSLTFQFSRKNSIQVLTLWRETPFHLIVPREFWDLEGEQFGFPVVDCRPKTFERVEIQSSIRLDHRIENGVLVPTGDQKQQEAMQALLCSRGGILQLACGAGKTVVALDFIARRGVPALIAVDTSQLLDQWMTAINQFLQVPGGVGLIADGQFDWRKPVVLATYTSLANRAASFPEEARRWFGTFVGDEGHHISAPTFSRAVDLTYGFRLLLTATPDRDDGLHVVYNFHIGKVIYRNLVQELKPRIYFKWTGLSLDQTAQVHIATKDKNGELHLGKLAGFFGRWRPRLELVLQQVRMAVAENRRIIVLSNSVDEVVNLLAMWNGRSDLYTDLPFPTATDVGEHLEPIPLESTSSTKKIHKQLGILSTQLSDPHLNPVKKQNLEAKKQLLREALEHDRVYKKCLALYKMQQKKYLKDLLAMPSSGGLMIYRVPVEKRTEMLKSKQVTFAIFKYGKEGLDEPRLDTVIVSEPPSSKNALQQIMGRIQRKKAGKQAPILVFLEDDIGPIIGMCKKLRGHLRSWPIEESGPYEYEMLDHPSTSRRRTWTTR